MGEADRYQEYRIRKHRLSLVQPGNALMWLIVFNVILYLILLFIKAGITIDEHSDALFYSRVANWFQLPAGLNELGGQPWTIISYMFSDTGFFRLLSNMLWLWAFGTVFQDLAGNRKLIPVYIYGGLAGALFFILAANLIPSGNGLISTMGLLGANPAVMAVAVAATFVSPGYRFFRNINGGIPLWILTVVYAMIDLAAVSKQPAAQPIAHIGGAVAGFLFVVLLKKNMDGSVWMNNLYEWISNLFNPDKTAKKNNVKEKVFYNTGGRNPYSKVSNVTQQRVDEILDKISQKGYDHLSKEEKDILKRASEDQTGY
jgi:membrane associated rhomboid family serine protease